MRYKYGEFTSEQIRQTKIYLRKQIYFLLLMVDPKTRDTCPNTDVDAAFDSLLGKVDGINEILFAPPEMVRVIGLLEEALKEYHKENFSFGRYRKHVLDAGAEVLKIKEVC